MARIDEQLDRVMELLGVVEKQQLADRLGLGSASAVSHALKRSKDIPESWLTKLTMQYSINPFFVLYGTGEKYVQPSSKQGNLNVR